MNEEALIQEKKPKRRWIFVTLLLFGVLFGAWYFWKKTEGPARGVITVGKQEFDVMSPDLPPPIVEFTGTYFTLYLPESYTEKRHETPERDGNVREQAFFTEESGFGRKVAITIEKRPQGGIHELSSFQFRTIKKDEYERDSFQDKKETIVVFNKRSPVYEITGYREQGNSTASISISSAVDPPEKLIGDFSDIMESFRWEDIASQ